MRILILLFGLMACQLAEADFFGILQDYNYEVVDSNSAEHGPGREDVSSVSINGKIYFIVNVPGDSFLGVEAGRLAVTDGTKDGTYLVKGLENKDLNRGFKSILTINNKLILIVGIDLTNDYEVWEISEETSEAVKVNTFNFVNNFNYGIIAHPYNQDKLILTGQQSRKLIIYDSLTGGIEELDLLNITSSAIHNVSHETFVAGEYFYYEINVSSSETHLYRLHLKDKVVEYVNGKGVGYSNYVINETVFFVDRDDNNDYQLYYMDVNTGNVSHIYGPLKSYYLSKETYWFKKNDHELVFNNKESLIVIDNNTKNYYLLDLPEGSALDFESLEEHSEYLNGEYYFLAFEYDRFRTGNYFLLKSDLTTEVIKAFDYKDLNISPYYLLENNGSLFTVVTRHPTTPNILDKTSSYRWDSVNQTFTLMWERSNFGVFPPVHESRKDIVYAYTVEDGSEPWRIDPATDTPVQLANFNWDKRTRGNFVTSKYSTHHRATVVYNLFYDLQNFNIFSLHNELFTGYIPAPGNDQVGIDYIYDYYHRIISEIWGYEVLTRVEINLYNSVTNEFYEFGTLGRVAYETFSYLDLDKGVLTYLMDGWIIHKGVDGTWEFEVDSVYSDLVSSDGRTIAYGYNESDEAIELITFDRLGIKKSFSIPCKGGRNNCVDPLVLVDGNKTLVSHSLEGPYYEFYKNNYIVNLEQPDSVKMLPIDILGDNGIPAGGPLAFTNDAILIGFEEIIDKVSSLKFITINLKEFTNTEVSVNFTGRDLPQDNNVANWLKQVGNYKLGMLDDNLDAAYIFVFNKNLELVDFKNLGLEPFDVQTESISIDRLVGCISGYCYVSANYWRKQGNDPQKYFTYKFDISLQNIEQEFSTVDPKEYILKNINTAYLIGESTQYGKEIYKQEVEGFDSDGDGIWDAYELAYDMDPTSDHDGALDIDGDGLSNYEEFKLGTNILKADTDDDGLDDGVEIDLDFDPRSYDLHLRDSDEDGLSYRVEKDIGTDHHNPDTDGDGYTDGNDAFPLDPSENSDFDGDGVGDNADPDDDSDGLPDEWEEKYGLDPYDPSDRDTDLDNDGISNYQEYVNGTDPTVTNNNSGGGNDNRPSSDSGGGGSMPILLLIILSSYVGFRLRRKT